MQLQVYGVAMQDIIEMKLLKQFTGINISFLVVINFGNKVFKHFASGKFCHDAILPLL